jgi:hypothetical protein
MGVLYTHSPKSLGPFPKLPEIHFLIKNSKNSKKLGQPDRRKSAAQGRLTTSDRPLAAD